MQDIFLQSIFVILFLLGCLAEVFENQREDFMSPPLLSLPSLPQGEEEEEEGERVQGKGVGICPLEKREGK